MRGDDTFVGGGGDDFFFFWIDIAPGVEQDLVRDMSLFDDEHYVGTPHSAGDFSWDVVVPAGTTQSQVICYEAGKSVGDPFYIITFENLVLAPNQFVSSIAFDVDL